MCELTSIEENAVVHLMRIFILHIYYMYFMQLEHVMRRQSYTCALSHVHTHTCRHWHIHKHAEETRVRGETLIDGPVMPAKDAQLCTCQ